MKVNTTIQSITYLHQNQLHSGPSARAAAGAGPALGRAGARRPRRPAVRRDPQRGQPRPHGTDHPLPPPRKIRRNEKKLLTIFYPADIIAELSGNAAIAQQVERILGKDEVSSPNLLSSSSFPRNLMISGFSVLSNFGMMG